MKILLMVLSTVLAVVIASDVAAAPASQVTSAQIVIRPAVKSSAASNSKTIFASGQGLFVVFR